MVSNSFDDHLPKLKVVRDQVFDRDMISTVAQNLQGSGRLAREARREFADIVNTRLIEKFDGLGTMSGAQWKEADSVIGKLARRYMRSDDPQKIAVGEALGETQIAWRNMISRANPDLADELNKINSSYAMMLRVEAAAKAARHNGGKFTPGQLQVAVTAPSLSTVRQAARGKALMQDWATAGERVLTPYQDSGTALRSAMIGAAMRPVAGAQAVATSFGLQGGLNAALRGATQLQRIKTRPAAALGAPFANVGAQE